MCKKFRNGHLSSENLRASAEAAVADQLPPGAHPVDLRSATNSPPLQSLLEASTTSPSLSNGSNKDHNNSNRQQNLQLPVDTTRLIPLSPTVILRQVGTEERPSDAKEPETNGKEVNEKPQEANSKFAGESSVLMESVPKVVVSEESQIQLSVGKRL